MEFDLLCLPGVSSNEGDLVLDPVCGCGTTVAAAQRLIRYLELVRPIPAALASDTSEIEARKKLDPLSRLEHDRFDQAVEQYLAVVDFATTQLLRAKEHAGTAAYIFRDLQDARRDEVRAISIIRQDGEDAPEVRWGVEVLGRHSQLVDWDDEPGRAAFLDERRVVAGL